MRMSQNWFIRVSAATLALTLCFSLTPITGVDSPASAAVAQRGEVCATGGACSVGDVGPGGGKIVYINQDNPVTSSIYSDGDVLVTTTYPHFLTIGETVSLVGSAPNEFSATLEIFDVLGANQFTVRVANQAAADLLSFGRIAKQPGWDMLQAAPVGWSGQETDPVASISTGVQANDTRTDWITKASIGSGRSNTNNLLDATISDVTTDAASIISNYGSEWFLPSASEMKVAGNVLASTPELAIANGLSEVYETSTLMTESGLNCELSNVAVWFRDQNIVGTNWRCDSYSIRPMRQILNRVWLNTYLNDQLTFAVRSYEVGGEVTLPRIANYGANLEFWSLEPISGSQAVADGAVTSIANVPSGATLYAYWAGTSGYDITFDGNGSTSGSVASVTWGIATLPVDLPAGDSLSKPGNVFAGWSETKNGQAISGGYEPPYSVTLYAIWNPLSCAVTFDAAGSVSGSAPEPITNSAGTAFELPLKTDLVNPGYRITGWSLTSGSTEDVSPYYCLPASSNTTLYPIWTLGTYDITFNGNENTSGRAPQTLTYTTNAVGTVLPGAGNLVRTGYSFGGWTDGNSTFAVGARYQTASDATLLAVWNPLTYIVSFSLGDEATGTAPSAVSYVVGTEAFELPDSAGFSRVGYQLLGWSFAPATKFDLQTLVSDPFTPRASRRLYAVWAQETGSCSTTGFCLPGDVGASGGKIVYVNQDIAIGSVTWAAGKAIFHTGERNNLQVGDRVTIKGATPDVYNITAAVERIDSEFDFLISLPQTTPVDYISGGYIEKKSGWDYLEFAPADWNASANAGLTGRKYAYGPNLALNGNQIGDGIPNTVAYLTATIDDPATDPVMQIKEYGAEWFLPSDRELFQAGSQLASNKSDATANGFTDYYASSTTYLPAGELETFRGMYFTSCVEFSDICNYATSPYYFDGYFAFRPMRAVKIRAVLDPNYARTAVTVVKGYVGKLDAAFVMPEPSRPGYTFDGWFDQAVGGNFVAPATVALTDEMTTSTRNLYAHWTENAVTVSFDANGKTSGAAPSEISWLASTGPISLGTGTMLKLGHHLTGWAETSNGSPVPTEYTPAGEVKLFAIWAPNVYSVEFSSLEHNAGEVPDALSYTYGTTALKLGAGNLVRTGYKFKGWSLTQNGAVVSNTFTPVNDTTLHAVWEAKKVRGNFRLSSSLKRSKSSANIALVTAEKTPIVVKTSGRCYLANVKSGRKVTAHKITASRSKGTCTVTITVAENATYAAFSQVLRITIK